MREIKRPVCFRFSRQTLEMLDALVEWKLASYDKERSYLNGSYGRATRTSVLELLAANAFTQENNRRNEELSKGKDGCAALAPAIKTKQSKGKTNGRAPKRR